MPAYENNYNNITYIILQLTKFKSRTNPIPVNAIANVQDATHIKLTARNPV